MTACTFKLDERFVINPALTALPNTHTGIYFLLAQACLATNISVVTAKQQKRGWPAGRLAGWLAATDGAEA